MESFELSLWPYLESKRNRDICLPPLFHRGSTEEDDAKEANKAVERPTGSQKLPSQELGDALEEAVPVPVPLSFGSSAAPQVHAMAAAASETIEFSPTSMQRQDEDATRWVEDSWALSEPRDQRLHEWEARASHCDKACKMLVCPGLPFHATSPQFLDALSPWGLPRSLLCETVVQPRG